MGASTNSLEPQLSTPITCTFADPSNVDRHTTSLIGARHPRLRLVRRPLAHVLFSVTRPNQRSGSRRALQRRNRTHFRREFAPMVRALTVVTGDCEPAADALGTRSHKPTGIGRECADGFLA